METEIYLIRHGQSIGNKKELYLGHTDYDLSELGYLQAEVAAKALQNLKIDVIYSSSLMRAHNTALPHANLRGLPVIDCDNLREIYLGDWEGVPLSYLRTLDSFNHGWTENFGTFDVPGGESVRGAANRFYNAVFDIAKENQGKSILIAAHAAVIRAFWGKVSEIPDFEVASRVKFPLNASLTKVTFDGEKLNPVFFSDTSHLEAHKNTNKSNSPVSRFGF